MCALLRGHALDDGFDALEGVVVDIDVADGFAHTRDHAGQLLDVAHLLDLLDLIVEVVKVELVLANLLLQSLGFFLIKLLLGALHQRDHVAHAEDSVGHTGGVEQVDGFHLLARTNKLDGLGHHRADTQCGTAAGVAVELGQHHTVEIEAVVEGLGRVDGILSRHGVDDKQGLVGTNMILQTFYLGHHLLVHCQASGGIDEHCVVAFRLGLLEGVVCYLVDVLVVVLSIDGHVYLASHHAQLLDGGRTIHVATHQQGLAVVFLLEHVGELAAERGLTRTLQTAHQDDGGLVGQFDANGFATHELSQLVVDNLHHELAWLDGGQHVHAQCFALHVVRETLGHFVVDIRIEQRAAHVLQRLGDIDLGDFSLTFQYLK